MAIPSRANTGLPTGEQTQTVSLISVRITVHSIKIMGILKVLQVSTKTVMYLVTTLQPEVFRATNPLPYRQNAIRLPNRRLFTTATAIKYGIIFILNS